MKYDTDKWRILPLVLLIITLILGAVIAVFKPEVRRFFGLE